MKTRSPAPVSGVALVIVLSFLVLISAITLGFFSSVSTELAASKAVSNSALTRQLADSAVNVVMAQLVDATKGQDPAEPVAWVSQPGMIRTFRTSGEPKTFYKLYSSDRMAVDGKAFSAADEVPPPAWNAASNSEYYTDLNAPAAGSDGQLVFPILDPGADGSGPDAFTVEGFGLEASPGFTGGPESPVNNRAPMPVKWIYVLKDGTFRAATNPSATSVTVTGASTANPIVGRIAFWADDETAKVNINTASEGTYWDVPRIFSAEDFGNNYGGSVNPGMAVCQPAQKEYQRYPGHPATTSLSPIFGGSKILPVTRPITAANASKLEPYYTLAPRVVGSGSGGGTRTPTSALVVDADRLYASVEELMFSPKLTGGLRIPNTSAGNSTAPGLLRKSTLQKTNFFLTAHSSAPETTLYNTPRVGIWPVHLLENRRTAFDKLSVFCATLGGKAYYFTRQNARSNVQDFSTRNAELYGYLQKLTDRAVPGFGGKFVAKYGAGPSTGITDRDQILTSIYDYIRCTNLSDKSTGATPFTPIFEAEDVKSQVYGPNLGEVLPIQIPVGGGKVTQGFGRTYTISEADLIFYGTAANKMRAVLVFGFASPMQGLGGLRAGLKFTVTGLETVQVNVGTTGYQPLGFKTTGTNFMENADASTHSGRSVGGTEGPIQAMTTSWSGQKNLTTPGGITRGNYPFFTPDFPYTAPSGAKNFKLKSGEIAVQIRSADTDNLVQTLRFRFPEGEFKLPGVVGGTAHDFNTRNWAGENKFNIVRGEDTVVGLQMAGTAGIGADPGDDATAGDTRILAALPDVPSEAVAGKPAPLFRVHQKYSTAGQQYAYGLHTAIGEPYPSANSGKLVNVEAFPKNGAGAQIRFPAITTRIGAGNQVKRDDGEPGDWDTGTGDQKDGAYINKPDEGDSDMTGTRLPYMLGNPRQFSPANNVTFSPNRQVPSPLMFGSIPTGVQRFKPWQTLLFHPRPEDPRHPGRTSPPDHLLADLFWMPVVEPYAISQPLATAGKINMNCQIMPFTYIRRDTGLQAVMKSTRFLALPLGDGHTYKTIDASAAAFSNVNRRRDINLTETLRAFDDKFKETNNETNIFKSATQICEMNLVPTQSSLPGSANASDYRKMDAFWAANKLTGDNMREKPYVDLYPRLTTKSNTYTVHVRVQALRKAPGSTAGQWVAGKDKVVGEYRGSSIVERYIDLNDTPGDFATDASLNIDQFYKLRVVSTKRFSP